MQKLEEMVLGLVIGARIANFGNRELRILNAHFLFATLAQGAPVKADQRGVAKIGIDTIETGIQDLSQV